MNLESDISELRYLVSLLQARVGGGSAPVGAFVQGGNAFGATAVVGTTDNNQVNIVQNGAPLIELTTTQAVAVASPGGFAVNSSGAAVNIESFVNAYLRLLTTGGFNISGQAASSITTTTGTLTLDSTVGGMQLETNAVARITLGTLGLVTIVSGSSGGGQDIQIAAGFATAPGTLNLGNLYLQAANAVLVGNAGGPVFIGGSGQLNGVTIGAGSDPPDIAGNVQIDASAVVGIATVRAPSVVVGSALAAIAVRGDVGIAIASGSAPVVGAAGTIGVSASGGLTLDGATIGIGTTATSIGGVTLGRVGGGFVNFVGVTLSTTASGGTATLPAGPAAFMGVNVQGTFYKMPLYNL